MKILSVWFTIFLFGIAWAAAERSIFGGVFCIAGLIAIVVGVIWYGPPHPEYKSLSPLPRLASPETCSRCGGFYWSTAKLHHDETECDLEIVRSSMEN
jgi:predicted membrane channel-forming protein YqfA (hemolysin III family)